MKIKFLKILIIILIFVLAAFSLYSFILGIVKSCDYGMFVDSVYPLERQLFFITLFNTIYHFLLFVYFAFKIVQLLFKSNFLNFTKLTYEEYKTAALNRKKAKLKKQLNNLEKPE